MPYRIENIVRKGKIACYKQFLLFSHFFHIYFVAMGSGKKNRPAGSACSYATDME